MIVVDVFGKVKKKKEVKKYAEDILVDIGSLITFSIIFATSGYTEDILVNLSIEKRFY